MRAVIVASGPSARGFEPPEGVTVIAVNGAIDWISRADYWFTLDPSPANQARMQHPRAGVRYCAAVPSGVILPRHVCRYRRVSVQGIEPAAKHTPQWWFWRWGCVAGLSEQQGCIHTGNSAYGALGLAYHLGAERVALVGVDASNEPRIEGGQPNILSHLPLLFASAIDQIEVMNCGEMVSNLPALPQQQGMAWLTQ